MLVGCKLSSVNMGSVGYLLTQLALW
jgi:hypothetical protein